MLGRGVEMVGGVNKSLIQPNLTTGYSISYVEISLLETQGRGYRIILRE